MKKSISAYIYLVALAILFAACGNTPAAQTTSSSLNKAMKQNAQTPTGPATEQNCKHTQPVTPTSTPTTQAQAQGSTDKSLAAGQLDALPQGDLFVNILSASQSPNESATHKDVAGSVYVVNGTQTLAEEGGSKQTLKAGEAAFTKNDLTYTHTNTGKSASEWYFTALRPTTTSTQTPTPALTPVQTPVETPALTPVQTPAETPALTPVQTPAATLPNQKTVYETPTLSASAFPKGAYCESLLLTEQQANGRSASQRHSGIVVLHVLEGSAKVEAAGQDPKTLSAGQSTYILPNTPMQVSNAGSNAARFLSFNAWPKDQPLRQDLAQIPAEAGTPTPTAAATETATPTEELIPTGPITPEATPAGPITPEATPAG